MTTRPERRRVLLLCDECEQERLEALFARGAGRDWEVVPAGSAEQARFRLQLDPCDVLLLDAGPSGRGADALGWLASPDGPPVLLLAEPHADLVRRALSRGAHYWVPRDLALRE